MRRIGAARAAPLLPYDSSMNIAFIKAHGLGNDFVVFDARRQPIALTPDAARRIADRRRGIGCDQIVLIEPPRSADAAAFMRILNGDGSEVAACGNASRWVAGHLMAEADVDRIRIETAAGPPAATRASSGAITVDMGPARLDWADIPLAEACDTLHLPVALGHLTDPVAVNVGNPHMVFFVEEAEAVPLAELGAVMERHPLFPERTNVEVVETRGPDRLRMRVWERGAGITQACGTGACAAAVAAHRRGLTGREVRIILDGGPLDIAWRKDGHVLMTGEASTSFRGFIEDAFLHYHEN